MSKTFYIFKLLIVLLSTVFYFNCSNTTNKKNNETDSLEILTDKLPEMYNKVSDNEYVYELAPIKLKIDPAKGARIVEFSYRNKNLFTSPEINAINYGATLWPSPQSLWVWPPIATLDSAAYQVKQAGNNVKFISAVDESLKIQFEKQIKPNAGDSSFAIHYTIYNKHNKPVEIAPWEVARVAKGGLIFYPAGDEINIRKNNATPVPFQRIENMYWYQDKKQLPEESLLKISDGAEGWLAYAWEGLLFVKTFKDVVKEEFAPGEGDVEIFVCGDAEYMELENQGKYKELQPNEKYKWVVKWYLRQIPDNIAVKTGNMQLVELVKKTINK